MGQEEWNDRQLYQHYLLGIEDEQKPKGTGEWMLGRWIVTIC